MKIFLLILILIGNIACSNGQKIKKQTDDSLNKEYCKKVKWLVNPTFDEVDYFKEGMGAVKINGKWGFLDSLGKITTPCKYDYYMAFSEGIGTVQKDLTWYFVKKNGDIINKSGYLYKNYGTPSLFLRGESVLQAKNGKYYTINKEGKVLTDSIFDEINGVNFGFKSVSINKKWGVIGNKGEVRIPLIYDNTRLIIDTNTIIASQNGKYGVLNLDGKLKIDFQFYNLFDGGFKDYLVYSVYSDTGRCSYTISYGLINKHTGKIVISAKYKSLMSAFDGSRILVETGINGGVKLLDLKENVLFAAEDSEMYNFGNNHYIANLKKQKKTLEIDSEGKTVKSYPLSIIYRASKNIIKIDKTLIDETTGKTLIPEYVTTSFPYYSNKQDLDCLFLKDYVSQKWGVVKLSELPRE